MTRPTVLKYLLYVLGGFVTGLIIYFAFIRPKADPVAEFASVRDTFTDVMSKEAAVVYFIRVQSYDSMQIRTVAEHYVQQEIAKPALASSKRRTILMHFFVEGDTSALNADMLDELAYTHPEVTEPSTSLLLVPGGYVMKVVYPENAQRATLTELKRTSFYMARPGIKAEDLRSQPSPATTSSPQIR
mgnify:CR=1 FL=1